jgi:phage shock protein E
MRIKTCVGLAVLLLLAACSAPAPAVTGAEAGGAAVQPYTDISPEELNTMLADKDFILVNTHIPFEGDLPDTDLSIPYNEIGENLRLLPADKDAKIVLYCRSDRMSREAAQELSKLGYTNLYNLAGGFTAWQAAGYPMAPPPMR